MNVDRDTHPTPESLQAFGLGKLDDRTSDTVAQHLETCVNCRQQVAALPGDSLLHRLQNAQRLDGTLPPAKSVAHLTSSFKAKAAEPSQPPALAPELANHPQYEILKELGRGGMGVVYLAKNKLMDRLEVLKVLNKSFIDRPGAMERFLREIQSAAKLQHENVVGAFSALQIGDLLAFAMEYVEGEDLSQVVKAQGPLAVPNACHYVRQAALGLQHAHEKGMVHRDIKPQNLILAREGKKHTVKILDFGLAKATRDKKLDTVFTSAGALHDTALTGTGALLGTPDYIAPEQTRDAATAGIGADIYSLGCTLYYLLTGKPPFKAKNLLDLLQSHQSVEAKGLNIVRPEVPAELAAIVAKMMAKEPADRYQKPLEVAQALVPFLKPGSGRPLTAATADNAKGEMRPVGTIAKPTPNQKPNVPTSPEPSAAFAFAAQLKMATPSPTKPRKHDIAGRGRNRLWIGGGVGLGLLFLGIVLLASGVLRVQTPEGVIVLEHLPPGAEVYVDGNQITVKASGTDESIDINTKPGSHKLEIRKGGFKIFTQDVSLDVGGRRFVNARLEPLTPASLKTSLISSESKASDTIDLLRLVDPDLDAVGGKVLRDGAHLVLDASYPTIVKLPYRPAEEYDVRMRFTLVEGQWAVALLFPTGSGASSWIMSRDVNLGGFEHINNKGHGSADNPTSKSLDRDIMNPGVVCECLVKVRRGSMSAVVNGKEISNWKGNSDSLVRDRAWQLPDNSFLAIGSYSNRVRVLSLEVREVKGIGALTRTSRDNVPPATQSIPKNIPKPLPAESTFPGSIDLLRLADPSRDTVHGKVRRDGDDILLDASVPTTILKVPYRPADEYDLRMKFAYMEGNNGIALLFPIGKGHSGWLMSPNVDLGGFEDIEGKGHWHGGNPTRKSLVPNILSPGVVCECLVKVRRGSMTAEVNGKEISKWEGNADTLVRNEFLQLPDNKHIGIGSFRSRVRVISLEVRELKDKGILTRNSNGSGKTDNLKDFTDIDPKSLGIEPFVPVKDAKSGFIIGGRNPTYLIGTLTSINGRPLKDLENDMRPGALSRLGFLGKDDNLLEVMAADNRFVVDGKKLTHQEVARPLQIAGAIAAKYAEEHPVEFLYCGNRYVASIQKSAIQVESPFNDNKKSNTTICIENTRNGKSISYSLLLPHLIDRYGFYEGKGTAYRRDPQLILEVFDFLPTRVKDLLPLDSNSLPWKTSRTGKEAMIRFVNKRQDPIDIFWIDDSGKLQPLGTIQPGEDNILVTSDGHTFLVAEKKDQFVAAFEAREGSNRVVIRPDTKFVPNPLEPSLPKPEERKSPVPPIIKMGAEITNSIGLKLVAIPPGKFTMGSPPSERARDSDEVNHEVEITKGFWIGKYEVTQEEFDSIMGSNRSYFKGPKFPVDCVSWNDAKEFCRKLSAKEGKNYALPTEAEWEYACRGGTKGPFSTGVNLTTQHANYDGNYPYIESSKEVHRQKTVAGDLFAANGFGLHNMHGNVWEWCEDWKGPYETTGLIKDPKGATEGLYRVIRGGSWSHNAGNCRSAKRNAQVPQFWYNDLGFRVVLRAVTPEQTNSVDIQAPVQPPLPKKDKTSVIPKKAVQKWSPLFNGKNMAGWSTSLETKNGWHVENGAIVGQGADLGYLWTKRNDHTDFHLRLEARIGNRVYAHLIVRDTFTDATADHDGYRIVMNNTNENSEKTGSLLAGRGRRVNKVGQVPGAGDDWFLLEVIAKNDRLIIKVDGQTVTDYTDPDKRFSRGCISFFPFSLMRTGQGKIEIRKVEISELP